MFGGFACYLKVWCVFLSLWLMGGPDASFELEQVTFPTEVLSFPAATPQRLPYQTAPPSSALPKLASLEISGFKTLKTLNVTGSSSLIHEILSRIASLDLGAIALVIHLSQAELSVPEPSRPPTREPSNLPSNGMKMKKPGLKRKEPDVLMRSDPPSIKTRRQLLMTDF